jgi:hypothetical protein
MAHDSLDIVAFVMEAEQQFGAAIADERADRIEAPADFTVGTLYQLLIDPRAESAPPPDEPRWRTLVAMVARFMDVPVDHVTWQTSPFV